LRADDLLVLKRWFAAHRSLVITATSAVVIAAVVATVAIVSSGYTAQKLDLNDSSVWVANGTQQAIGRANTAVRQLNTVVPTTGTDLDVVQNGSTVLMVDNANSKLEQIDPATSTVTDSIPLPPNHPEVFLSANNVVILSEATGQLWITPIADLSSFDAQSPADLTLGAGAVASMDDAGTMFAYSPTSHEVSKIVPDVSNGLQATASLNVSAKDTLSISSVADQWAVLDATTRKLYVAGNVTSLRGTAAASSPVLQVASSTGDSFLVAGSTGVARVPTSGSSVANVVTGRSGTPAAPLVADGCQFAAWSDGHGWRQCANSGSSGTALTLAGMPNGPKLELRFNGDRVVLNDSRSGAAWAVQDSGQLINNWNDLIPKKDQQNQQQNSEDTPPPPDKQEQPPVAVDDQLGARPGRANVLRVLLNDYDPNGDVLVITNVTPISSQTGYIDLINNRQQLQLTLESSASGTISFQYTISDGRGGTSTATVTVNVRGAGENLAPKQEQASKSIVVAGGQVTTQVLGDWVDPDADPMYLSSVSVDAPDTVSFKPDGTVTFSDAGKGGSLKTVTVVVSDGKATATGSLIITVKPVGKVPIIADPFVVIATSGLEVTVSPLQHVSGGSAAIRLNSVPSKSNSTITPSYSAGTFQFESNQVGTHYIDYVVTDGDVSATGTVRIEVVAPPETNSKPITTPKTIFVQTLSSQSIDVADSDIDPAGGVLLVTGISAPAQNSGVRAEVLEQSIVRVTLVAPLDAPVSFNYTVSNGLADAQGTITVIEIPIPTKLQPPIANDDSVTTRVGAAIDIPVLTNDDDPNGLPLRLVPTLAQNLPSNGGLLFASGDVLRYLAPSKPGNFTAVYAIAGPDGQTARAQVTIAVREPDVSSNNPPVPLPIVGRVLAGGSVTIKVPLSGIDPDGDTVQLLGQATSPQKGSVTSVGPDSITYKAGDYSAGTDSFTYTVIDSLGARATGTVRVGIAPKLSGSPNPVASLDDVTVRPGVTVSVQVLANDSDPNGRPLHIVSAVPNDKVTTAKVSKDLVIIKPPAVAGTYGVVYTIANDVGGQSSAFVRVTVDPNAPLAVPVASDTVLTLSDILGRSTLDVNVLGNVFFADGPSTSLGLSIYPGFGDTAQVTADKEVQVTVTAHSQIIPFKVTHPNDPSVFSYAFIWVPGTDDALPQVNERAAPLTVKSESRLVINLNDYVIAVNGKQVRLTDSTTVSATNSNGDNLVVDSQTLQYTSAPRYFGEASISFTVTDGDSATDPNGHVANLVLPIEVLPRDNQPPVFTGAEIDMEPGQHEQIDLVKLTNYPHPNDQNELTYNLISPLPTGVFANLDGQQLNLSANDNAPKDTTVQLSIGVRDKVSVGTSGRISISIVPSTRPLAQPAPDFAAVQRGQTTTVDVLANDNATNPFPGDPLKVIAIRGLDGNSLPDGVTITPNADRSKLSVSVSSTAVPSSTSLQYEVADSSGDPDRYVWGSVQISVQDRPDPVTRVRTVSFGDRQLVVAWSDGSSNNSPITGYQIAMTDATTGNPISTTNCTGSLCTVTTPGNGPSNSVRLAVTATNAIGTSDPTTNPGPVWSDVVPGAPSSTSSTPLDHGLQVSWTAPPANNGSAITSYVISVDGASPVTVGAGTFTVGVTDPSIANGSSVNYSVSARNGAFASLATWNSAGGTGYPAGAPQVAASPTATADTSGGGDVSLSWDGVFSSNGRAVTDYYAAISSDPAPNFASCTVSGGLPANAPDSAPASDYGTATSHTFTGLSANTTYSLVVWAFNGMGCTSSTIVTAVPRSAPGTVTGISYSGPISTGANTWDFRLDGYTIGSGSTDSDSFEYQLSGGNVSGETDGPKAVSSTSFLTTSNNSQYGQNISVQVKACKQYPEVLLCSANWSNSFALGVPVENGDAGVTFSHDPYTGAIGTPGAWSWSSWPASAPGSYTSVQYDCGHGVQTITTPDGHGECDVNDTGDGIVIGHTFHDLTITINTTTGSYARTYVWPGD
jgi:hypothetical protein